MRLTRLNFAAVALALLSVFLAVPTAQADLQLWERVRSAGGALVGQLGAERCFLVTDAIPHPAGGHWAPCVSLATRPAEDPAIILRWHAGDGDRGRALTAGTLVTAHPARVEEVDVGPDIVTVHRDRRRWLDKGSPTIGTWGFLVLPALIAQEPELVDSIRDRQPGLWAEMVNAQELGNRALFGRTCGKAPPAPAVDDQVPVALTSPVIEYRVDAAAADALAEVDAELAQLEVLIRGGAPRDILENQVARARDHVTRYFEHQPLN